jgi:hypothetical protein
MVKQLMQLRGGCERDDNQQISDEQTNERPLPAFGVAKSLHFHPFKALYTPSQNDCCEKNPPLFNKGGEDGVASGGDGSDFSEMIFA